jgi:hypothetical protein
MVLEVAWLLSSAKLKLQLKVLLEGRHGGKDGTMGNTKTSTIFRICRMNL